jgi:hypothetical protein
LDATASTFLFASGSSGGGLLVASAFRGRPVQDRCHAR